MNTNAKVGTAELAALLDEPSARPWWQRRSVWGGVAAVWTNQSRAPGSAST